MREFPVHSRLTYLILGVLFLHVGGNAAQSDTLVSQSLPTQPSTIPAKLGANAIAAARQVMLNSIDQHIAALRDLLAEIPEEQRSQSETNRHLQDAIAERARIESATDGDIASLLAAQIAARHADAADKPEPLAMNPPAPIGPATTRHSAATRPAISFLEAQFVFPGSSTHGRMDAVVGPMAGCELVPLHAPDGTKIVALFGRSPTLAATGVKPALLYFYGNGTCMAYSREVFNGFRSLGFNVITVDYEGYGMSDGTPSEAGCYAAADAAYDYLLTRKDVDHNRIVATGWSLGAAVAIDLASRRKVAGLVTFSAFTNILDMSESLTGGFPLGILLSCRFDNLAKINSVSCPILMAHGSRDTLVPPEMLDRLSGAARSKVTTFRVEGAEHNDIFQRGGELLYLRVKAFVDGLSDVSPTTRPQ